MQLLDEPPFQKLKFSVIVRPLNVFARVRLNLARGDPANRGQKILLDFNLDVSCENCLKTFVRSKRVSVFSVNIISIKIFGSFFCAIFFEKVCFLQCKSLILCALCLRN